PRLGATLAAATGYAAPAVQALVKALKYEGRRDAALPLATLIKEQLALLLPVTGAPRAPFPLVPVPLHRSRERTRGFNQSFLIADALGRLLPGAVAIAPGLLLRERRTVSQTECADRLARERNVAGGFAVPNPERVRGKTVILVDDVCTSGATAREAARELRKAGAAVVIAATAARA
ncbi:MAG: phosphoribosyltransferase family protein, partial [bacterium]